MGDSLKPREYVRTITFSAQPLDATASSPCARAGIACLVVTGPDLHRFLRSGCQLLHVDILRLISCSGVTATQGGQPSVQSVLEVARDGPATKVFYPPWAYASPEVAVHDVLTPA